MILLGNPGLTGHFLDVSCWYLIWNAYDGENSQRWCFPHTQCNMMERIHMMMLLHENCLKITTFLLFSLWLASDEWISLAIMQSFVIYFGVSLNKLLNSQATSHYLSICWPIFPSPYGITRPQCVNTLVLPQPYVKPSIYYASLFLL